MKKRNIPGLSLAAAALLGVCAAGVSGCIRQTDVPIIAEKASQGESAGEGDSAGHSGTQNGADGGDSSVTQNDANGTTAENPIIFLAKPPERYQTSVREGTLEISADAPVILPEISRIPILEVEKEPYKKEDCNAALELLKGETGVTDWEGGESAQSYTSEDGNYQFSFGQGSGANYTPMMWLTNLVYSDGSNGEWDAADVSDFALTGTAREAREAELKKKAEDFLQRLSLSDFHLESAQWRRISTAKNGGALTDDYGLRLTYVRSFEGIPVINREAGWASDLMAPSQYVEFLDREDGTLLRMKDINRERVSANLGAADTLLSFGDAAQIFEQYLKYYETVYDKDILTIPKQADGYYTYIPTESPSGQNAVLSIDVSKVQFAYQLLYDEEDNEAPEPPAKGRLVPVWAFYGTPTVTCAYWSEDGGSVSARLTPPTADDGLLLTVNAVDGTVYGKE